MEHHNEQNQDYNLQFKKIYYYLYSNSSVSRAEIIISDITKILLCKLIAEKNDIKDIATIPSYKLIELLRKQYPESAEQFNSFELNDRDISEILSILDCIKISAAPSHIIGDAFQSIIGPKIRGDKGQFFTPKELVQCMVDIINPQKKDVIIDPACGTGGFLSETYSYCKRKYGGDTCSDVKLIGIDKDKDMANIAFATTHIISQGNCQVINNNSLNILSPACKLHSLLETADIILTNPPFGSKIGITDEKTLELYEFGHNWAYSNDENKWYKLNSLSKNQAPQILFLELCVRLLKPHGKMAIVLPEGIFGNKSLGYIWTYLQKHGKILAMIDCPRNTFQPSTDTKTNVLFYEKTTSFSTDVYVSIAKNCGHDKRGRVKDSMDNYLPNDFELIAQSYNDIPNSTIWKKVKFSGNYFVPRYLVGKMMFKNTDNFISIREMIERGFLKRKCGREIGSEAYGTGTIPFIRTSDIINFEISCDPTNAVSEEIYQQYALQQNLSVGDILFIADGRYRIGKTAIITQYNIKCLIQSHIEILSLTEEAPFSAYEFLYCLNMNEVQEQIRNLIFVQSTLGTIGNRIEELLIPIPPKTAEWQEKIHAFQQNIEMRAKCLVGLQKDENSFEL